MSVFTLLDYCWLIAAIFIQESISTVRLLPSDSVIKRLEGGELVVKCMVSAPHESRWISPTGDSVSEDPSGRFHVERGNDGLVLRFKGLRTDDRGQWRCEAGRHGQKSFALEIDEPVTLSARNIEYAPMDEDYLINCLVNQPSKVTVAWKKGPSKTPIGDGLNYLITPAGLHIQNVRLSDNDTFWCTTDVFETGTTLSRRIQVIVCKEVTVPHITCDNEPCAVYGGKAVLRCHSSGIPAPKYQWSKGPSLEIQASPDFKYHTNGNTLIINKLNASDNGNYECRAYNEYDRKGKTANFTVNVLVPPIIQPIAPVLASLESEADLVCLVDRSSSRGVKITWSFANRSRIPLNDRIHILDDIQNYRSVLRFKMPTKEMFDNYTCEVTNIAGESRALGELRVNFAPEYTPGAPKIFYGVERREAIAVCSFDGYPLPVITWHMDYANSPPLRAGVNNIININNIQVGPYRTQSVLKLIPMNIENGIVFICMAENQQTSKSQILIKRASFPDKPSFRGMPRVFSNSIYFTPLITKGERGLPVKYVELRYKQVSSKEEKLVPPYTMKRFNVTGDKQSVVVSLSNLLPSTMYRLGIISYSEVGASNMSENLVRTTGRTHPIVELSVFSSGSNRTTTIGTSSVNQSSDPISCNHFTNCHIKWRVLSDGGSPVTGYEITYSKIRSSSPDKSTAKTTSFAATVSEYVISGLFPLSGYHIQFKAGNKMESGMTTFRVKTSASPPGYREMQEARKRPSVWAVVGIILMIIAVLILLCLLVVCLRMPKPTGTSGQFDQKLNDIMSPDSSIFNPDLRNSMQPLNPDSARNFNPLYKETNGLDSPWNGFTDEHVKIDRRAHPFGNNTDTSRV